MFAALCIVSNERLESELQPDSGSRWERIYARKLEVETVAAFKLLRHQGVEPVLIKGWAAARHYPPEKFRPYTDIDLAVSASEYDRARTVLESPEGRRIGVDLHRELRHLDTKPWNEILRDSQIVNLDGCDIRVASPEDHLRILAVHWLNDGGERKERLWDIYYAISARSDELDWDKCLGDVAPNRRGWMIAVIGLTHRYLGLPLDGLPFAEEARDLPRWLVKTLEREWESGVLHRSLHTSLNDPPEFFRQLRKRIPPNPLQATIECDGSFDAVTRLPYQLKCMMRRALPSVLGLAQTLRRRSK